MPKMWLRFLFLAVAFEAAQGKSFSNELVNDPKVSDGLKLLKFGCGTVASSKDISISGNAEGSITLKKLPGAEAGGSVKLSQKETEGLASALKKEIDNNSYNLSKDQLDCMRPYIDMLFKYLLKNDEKSERGKRSPVTPRSEKKVSPPIEPPSAVSFNAKTRAKAIENDGHVDVLPETPIEKINNVLLFRFGQDIGHGFRSSGWVVQKRSVKNPLFAGRFNCFSYTVGESKDNYITAYTDEKFQVFAIMVENANREANRNRKLKEFYMEMIKAWGDADPVYLTKNHTGLRSSLGSYGTNREIAQPRMYAGIKYMYMYEEDDNYPEESNKTKETIIISSLVE